MRNETHIISEKLETQPTGSKWNTHLEEIKLAIQNRSEVESAVGSTVYIRKYGAKYRAKIESNYGSQEEGYLVELEIKGDEEFNREDANQVFLNCKMAIEEVFGEVASAEI